ncbi:MAG: orotidine-5'-phosphate decarboxylase [Verrucomicrobia bacterium]|nr:orotidine-5'-phosphate decarboxylase [Verrucomicrobiota bacterium]
MTRNPIIAALDVPTATQALEIAQAIAPHVGMFKVGGELFTRCGPSIVASIVELGRPVFLDLKFHDIPNTVRKSVGNAVALGVQMLTVHTSGGSAMLAAAAEAARGKTLVLGVTVLTSLDDNALRQVGVNGSVTGQVERLAQLAVQSGLQGLVCSPLEIQPLRRLVPGSTQLVTPGIRPSGAPRTDDQARTLSAREAMRAGANWIVVGRPIYAAPDPAAAAEKLEQEVSMEGGA